MVNDLGLDTLCAQAYGSGKKELVGLHLQRMALFLFAITVPIGVLWIFSGPVLSALVPESALCHMAGDYLRIYLFGAPGFALFEAGKRFTQAQGLFNASLIVLLICTPINIWLNYLFVFVWDLGLAGAAWAVAISNNLLPLFLFFYVRFINPSSLVCWGGFSKQAFKNWGPMIKLSLPGIIMVEAEWLAFDILTFSASYLSTAHLAAQSIVMTICMVMFHIPFSVSIAVSTRLGNLVGSGSLQAARIASRAYVTIFVVMGLINGTFLTVTRHVLPNAFSEDPEVIKIASQVMPIIAAFQLFDCTTALVNGMLRALGRQKIGGYANLIVYYVVAVPLALFLCFRKPHLELAGLWIGCVVGSGLITLSEGTYLGCSNWQRAVDEAKMRDGEPTHIH
jgi:MATE family multidrug resistance protein